MALVTDFRRDMPSLADAAAWKSRAADLPLLLIAGMVEQRANPPLPTLMNTSGDPLELVTAHYRIRDLTIEQPEIESIVRHIYEEGL